jgi:tetratricopeptide (TPR) repeat protein
MNAGNEYLAGKNYDKALIEFQAAQIAARECGFVKSEPANKLKEVFKGLTAQRDEAVRQRSMVTSALKLAEYKTDKANAALKLAGERLNYAHRVATAINLASQAKAYEQTDPQFAILLATYAFRQFYDNEDVDQFVESTLRQVMADRSGSALVGHFNKMRATTFNHSGTLAATGDGIGVIKLWDLTNPDNIHFLCNLDFNNGVGKLQFSSDDNYLIANFSAEYNNPDSPTVVMIWDVSQIPKIPALVYVDTCRVSGISEDGQMWALIDKNEKLRIHRLGQHNLYEPVQTFDISSLKHIDGLTFSTTNKFLGADTHDSLAYVWQLVDGNNSLFKGIKTRDAGVFNLAFSPDDNDLLIASGSPYRLDTLYSLYSLKEEIPRRKILFNPKSLIISVFLRDTSVLAVCENGEVYNYLKEKDSLVLIGSIPSSTVARGVCSKDGKMILINTDSGTVYQLKRLKGEISIVGKYKSNNEIIDEIALSGDSKHAILTSYADKIPLLIDLAEGSISGALEVVISNNKNKVVACFKNKILVFDNQGAFGLQQVGEIESSIQPTTSLSPDGNWLLAVTDTSSFATLYSLHNNLQKVGEPLARGFDTEFSPNSKYLVIRQDSSIWLYSLDYNDTALLQKKLTSFPVAQYSFSPDSKWIYLDVEDDSNIDNPGRLIFLPTVFTTNSPFLVKGLSGDYKSFVFSPNSDVLFCMDGNKKDSSDYRMYSFRLNDGGEVFFFDSLTNDEQIYVLRSSDIDNKIILKMGNKFYCTKAEVAINKYDYLPNTDNLSFDKIYFSPNAKWILGFDRNLPIAKLWRTDSNSYELNNLFVEPSNYFYKIPLPFKNASSFVNHFFSPDSKYLGVYSAVEPSIFMYCLSDSVNYDSSFTLVNFDNNNLTDKIEFSHSGDTLYVLNHNKSYTSSSLNRYSLSTHSELPVTIIPPSAYITDFGVKMENSTIIAYGSESKVWQTNLPAIIHQAQNFTGRNFTLSEWRRLGNKPIYQPVFDSVAFDETYFYNFFSPDSLWGVLDESGRVFQQMKYIDLYINKSQDFTFCILAGSYLLKRGNLETAILAFARAEFLLPNNDWSLVGNAYISGCEGNFKKAINDFTIFLENNEDSPVKVTINKILRKLKAEEKLKAKDWPFHIDMIN